MRPRIPVAAMRAIAATLAGLGIHARMPCSNDLESSLSLHEHGLILRVHCIGRAILYDPAEGSLNFRIPKVTWATPFGRGWTAALAKNVHAFLTALAAPAPPVAAPPPTAGGEWQAFRILDLCAQGVPWDSIARDVGQSKSHVRKVITGQHRRYNIPERPVGPYMAKLDPQRRGMLVRRDQSRLPDGKQLADLRSRLSASGPLVATSVTPALARPAALLRPEAKAPPVRVKKAPPVGAKRSKAPPFTLEEVRHILLDKWGNGSSVTAIADENGFVWQRVYHAIVGGFRSNGQYKCIHTVVEGVDVEPFRRAALAQREAAGIRPDRAAGNLQERLDGKTPPTRSATKA